MQAISPRKRRNGGSNLPQTYVLCQMRLEAETAFWSHERVVIVVVGTPPPIRAGPPTQYDLITFGCHVTGALNLYTELAYTVVFAQSKDSRRQRNCTCKFEILRQRFCRICVCQMEQRHLFWTTWILSVRYVPIKSTWGIVYNNVLWENLLHRYTLCMSILFNIYVWARNAR